MRVRHGAFPVLCATMALVSGAIVPDPSRAGGPEDIGSIAYISADRASVRAVSPDGTGDRLVWSVPAGTVYGIQDVAWAPDGSHLAIASGHEALCSVFQYDLFTLRPDGSDLQRVTNPPACDRLAALPQGSVSALVDNLATDAAQVFVYVSGAPEAQLVTVPGGTEVTVSFPKVADLGPGVLQEVVAFEGSKRWYSAAASVDVLPGEVAIAETPLEVSGDPFDSFGALSVTWGSDGARLGYQFGQGSLWQVGSDPSAGAGAQPLFDVPSGEAPLGSDLAWSPVDDRVLYERFDTDPWTVTLGTADGTDAGDALVTVNLTHGIAWLPDGSGFVASDSDSLLASANLYHVDIATGEVTALTAEDGAFAYWPSVSPDGLQVAYTRFEGSSDAPSNIELRVMGLDGSDDRVIAVDAIAPNWGAGGAS